MCVALLFADAPGGLLGKVLEGIIVSLLVAAIVSAITAMTRRGRSYINHLSGIITVQGKWDTVLTRNGKKEEHESAELQQLLNRVWGETETLRKSSAATTKYKVRGRIHGHMLILTYRPAGGPGFDSGVIILHVNDTWDEMLGYEAGPDAKEKGKIKAFEYKWTKEGSAKDKASSAAGGEAKETSDGAAPPSTAAGVRA